MTRRSWVRVPHEFSMKPEYRGVVLLIVNDCHKVNSPFHYRPQLAARQSHNPNDYREIWRSWVRSSPGAVGFKRSAVEMAAKHHRALYQWLWGWSRAFYSKNLAKRHAPGEARTRNLRLIASVTCSAAYQYGGRRALTVRRTGVILVSPESSESRLQRQNVVFGPR